MVLQASTTLYGECFVREGVAMREVSLVCRQHERSHNCSANQNELQQVDARKVGSINTP